MSGADGTWAGSTARRLEPEQTRVPTASYFIAAVHARQDVTAEREASRAMQKVPGARAAVSWSSDSLTAHVCASPVSSLETDLSGQVVVVVHGALYPDSDRSPALRLLQGYLKDGIDVVSALHGSFALLVLDKRIDRAFFVTDHVNSRRLYHGERDGCRWVSTAQGFQWHPLPGLALDPSGVAQYLIYGTPFTRRTVFDGVRVLPRACVHEVTPRGLSASEYWRFEPGGKPERAESALRDELEQALVVAVRRRLPHRARLYLSLSAGFDSTTVLGVLHSLGVEDVRCFSYTTMPGAADEDALISRKMAERLGYSHLTIPGCHDDLGTVIAENVRFGMGLGRLVVETDAWRSVGDLIGPQEQATIWTGDQCLGFRDLELRDAADVLRGVGPAGWEALGWLGRLLPDSASASLAGSLQEDLLDLLTSHTREGGDLHDMAVGLYLDHRLPKTLCWREAFAGSYGDVRAPLLDRDVLDVVQSMPTRLRRGKRLFKDTATKMFPNLFNLDRATRTSWLIPLWAAPEISRRHGEIAEGLKTPSPLDQLVPPDVVRRLIFGDLSAGQRLDRLAGVARRRVQGKMRATWWAKSAPRRPLDRTVKQDTFVLRVLFLREFLSRRVGPYDLPAGPGASGSST